MFLTKRNAETLNGMRKLWTECGNFERNAERFIKDSANAETFIKDSANAETLKCGNFYQSFRKWGNFCAGPVSPRRKKAAKRPSDWLSPWRIWQESSLGRSFMVIIISASGDGRQGMPWRVCGAGRDLWNGKTTFSNRSKTQHHDALCRRVRTCCHFQPTISDKRVNGTSIGTFLFKRDAVNALYHVVFDLFLTYWMVTWKYLIKMRIFLSRF